MAFDFPQWRDWVQAWAEAHRATFVEVECILRQEEAPSISLGFKTAESIAALRFWENGLVDFEVFDLALDTVIASETAIQVDDESFALEFGRFIAIAGVAPA